VRGARKTGLVDAVTRTVKDARWMLDDTRFETRHFFDDVFHRYFVHSVIATSNSTRNRVETKCDKT
jgi:hypothetical protein